MDFTYQFTELKAPWLIQRCMPEKNFSSTMKVSEAFRLDYMGSAEFEFGSVPAALRLIEGKLKKTSVHTVTIGQIEVSILIEQENLAKYEGFLKDLIWDQANRSGRRLKEAISIDRLAKGEKTYRDDTFWIDLNNGVVFGLKRTDVVNFQAAVKNSVRYMDQVKGKKS